MLSFQSYIAESFQNLIRSKDDSARSKLAEEVFALLQASYAKIGGIKGSGFRDAQDMIEKIPFWKLYIRSGKVIVAVLYKDSNGRKLVAAGVDRDAPGSVKLLSGVLRETIKVSFGEYSKGLLVLLFRSAPIEVLRPFILKPKEVESLLGEKIIVPTQEYVNDNLSESDQAIWGRFKSFREYFYVREIGGTPLLKMSVGTPNKIIK